MLNLNRIERPATVARALELLKQPGTVALAGGTELLAAGVDTAEIAVDLSGLGLAYLREDAGAIAIGAMTTLTALDESPMLRAFAGGVLAQAAHRSAASILRNQATLAGTLIAEPGGILAVALLALDARVTIVREQKQTVPMAEWLAQRTALLDKALLTEIVITMTHRRGALETVARTPSDKPIVAACAAARVVDGVAHEVRVALGGVAGTAVRAAGVEHALQGQALSDAVVSAAAAQAAQGLAPAGDFRGSAEYRAEMAVVLTRRAIGALADA